MRVYYGNVRGETDAYANNNLITCIEDDPIFRVGYWSFENSQELNQEANYWDQSPWTYGIAEDPTGLPDVHGDGEEGILGIFQQFDFDAVADDSGEAVLWEPSTWTCCASAESASFYGNPGTVGRGNCDEDVYGEEYHGAPTPEEFFWTDLMLGSAICAENEAFVVGPVIQGDGSGGEVLERAHDHSSHFATPEDEFEAKQRILEIHIQSDDIEHNDELFMIPASIANAYVPLLRGRYN